MSTSAVPIPTSFTFRCLQQTQVTWTLTSATGTPVTGMTVLATLYVNRSRSNPTLQPGTVADPGFSSLVLTETVPSSSGIYVGVVPVTFNPTAALLNNTFTVVITASAGSTLVDTWNIPATVLGVQSVDDLVQLDDVKTWLGIELNNTDSDATLQLLISSFSEYVRVRTGRDSFTAVNTYTEIYNGNGAPRMFLRNIPIVSIISIIVGGYTIPQSTGLLVPGWFIEQSKKSIAIRYSGGSYFGGSTYITSGYSVFPQAFARGIGNIQVIYTAGHTSVPYDLYEVAMKVCALNYKRKDWIDLGSKSLGVSGSTGTTSYRSWARPPEAEEVIQHYTRRALV